jgi:hypothetical protein
VHAPVEVARLQLRRWWRGLVGIAVTRVVTVVTIACVAGVLPSLAGLRHRPADVLRAK